MSSKTYDFVLFGATGYTGRQVLRYLLQLPTSALGKWAVAGRNRHKLDSLLESAGRNDVDCIIADSTNPSSIESMISQTNVIINIAGPYSSHGEEFFTACIEHGTDYVDLGGETFWIRKMIRRYHEKAVKKKVKLIPICGFESLPFDFGSLLAVKTLKERHQVSCAGVEAAVRFIIDDKKVLRDRTLSSGSSNSGKVIRADGNVRSLADPYFLDPEVAGLSQKADLPLKREYELKPRFDSRKGVWLGPVFPAHFLNPPVIHRSHALFAEQGDGYGEYFYYVEGTDTSSFTKYLMSQRFAAWVMSVGARNMLKQQEGVSPVRRWINQHLTKGGTLPTGIGPKEELLDKFHYEVDFVAGAASGEEVEIIAKGKGSPGYRSTPNMIAEAGLALAFDQDLPEIYGIVTPASGLGLGVRGRLERAGLSFTVKG